MQLFSQAENTIGLSFLGLMITYNVDDKMINTTDDKEEEEGEEHEEGIMARD